MMKSSHGVAQPNETYDRLSRQVISLAQSMSSRLRELRRYLHARPEISEGEYDTTRFLFDLVKDLGLDPSHAHDHLGLWADVEHGADNDASVSRVAIRADIDALPIQTTLEASYASKHDGLMHACGHDAHATMVWGSLAILRELQKQETMDVKFKARGIFQPAEETSAGGPHMIRSGALDGVDAAIALHVDPSRPVATFGFRENAFTAGCDVFTCRVKGLPGHGARPHLTSDTISASVVWMSMFFERLQRTHDAHDPIVANVGQLQAGQAPNVVPGEVLIRGTIRGLSSAGMRHAKETIQRISQAVEVSYGVTVTVDYGTHTPPVVNDPFVCATFRDAAVKVVGTEAVREIEFPSMGAEDFAFIANTVPAAMMRIGVAGIDVGSQPLHTPNFDIDEASLSVGAAVLALSAIELSNQIESSDHAKFRSPLLRQDRST